MSTPKAPKPTWTPADEQALHMLTERKNRFMEVSTAPLGPIVIDLTPPSLTELDRFPIKEYALRKFMVKMLINKADEIRDALAPFDSGVRPADTTEG